MTYSTKDNAPNGEGRGEVESAELGGLQVNDTAIEEMERQIAESMDALARTCPTCGARAEWPDCEACGHSFVDSKGGVNPRGGDA